MLLSEDWKMTSDNNELTTGAAVCIGCGRPIEDVYVMRVQPDLSWHASCLKCYECCRLLDESCTCFVKDGKTYCKPDYLRLFGTKCAGCNSTFGKNEFIMRAGHATYHVDCFRCVTCDRRLVPGDEFARRSCGLLCKADSDAFDATAMAVVAPSSGSGAEDNYDSCSEGNNNASKSEDAYASPGERSDDAYMSPDSCCEHRATNLVMHGTTKAISGDRSNHQRNIQCCPSQQQQQHPHKDGSGGIGGKTTRIRTVLNEKQLHTLRACYAANPRPDALMKEQLVEMTNLSPRVIRVWFQNKRCKDKKKSILLKQLQQAGHNEKQLSGMHSAGISDNLGSPCSGDHRHEELGLSKQLPHAYRRGAADEWGVVIDNWQCDQSAGIPYQRIGSMYGGSGNDSIYGADDKRYMAPGSTSSRYSDASDSPASAD